MAHYFGPWEEASRPNPLHPITKGSFCSAPKVDKEEVELPERGACFLRWVHGKPFYDPRWVLHQDAHHIKSSSDDLVTLSNAGGGGVGARLRPRRPFLTGEDPSGLSGARKCIAYPIFRSH